MQKDSNSDIEILVAEPGYILSCSSCRKKILQMFDGRLTVCELKFTCSRCGSHQLRLDEVTDAGQD